MRAKLKQAGNDKQRDEDGRKFGDEMEKQRVINKEAMKATRKIQREEEWLLRKIQIEKDVK